MLPAQCLTLYLFREDNMNTIKSLGLLAAALIAVAGCSTPTPDTGGAPAALVPGSEVDAAK